MSEQTRLGEYATSHSQPGVALMSGKVNDLGKNLQNCKSALLAVTTAYH
jgi:hypothetical protein